MHIPGKNFVINSWVVAYKEEREEQVAGEVGDILKAIFFVQSSSPCSFNSR